MQDLRTSPDPLFLSFQAALAGRYSIDRELGRGGMGVVYLAREVHLDRLVAIKLLPPELSVQGELRNRFLREAQLAAKLSHPNIIPIHAVTQMDDFVYYVMAFVDGETLAQRVQSRGPLSASDATRLLREVAWALGYAHGQGLVHRDVKPDNILIETATGRALVADFGIAAATGDVLADAVCGTPEFMSPEQALGRDVDLRSDIYSLGATAFYALSGRLPFEGSTATELLAQKITANAPALTTAGTSVPRKLAQIVDACLAMDPAGRPANAQALADQLGLAIEQRRELPVALRAFVKRDGRMDGGGTLIGLSAALLTSVVVSSFTNSALGVLALGASIAVTPLIFGVVAAKRLLDLGFARADLAPAFRAEQASSREERSVVRRPSHSWKSIAEKVLIKIARSAATTAALLTPFAIARLNTARYGLGLSIMIAAFGPVGSLIVASLALACVASFGVLILMQFRRDVDVEFWSAAWTGRFGTFALAVARRWRGSKPVVAAMTHRATELSLGMAAEQLFEGLPKVSREALGDVPEMLRRLQRDAHLLRERHDALNDALAQAGSAAATSHYEAVREERDALHARMRDTVAAMETIRLGLLRLHAGSMSLESLTTHISLARDASADVERLVAAQAEVEHVLRCMPNVHVDEIVAEPAASERAQLTPV